MSDEELKRKYGPCWKSVVKVLKQADELTDLQAESLSIAMEFVSFSDAGDAAEHASWNAGRYESGTAEDEAWDTAWAQTLDVAREYAGSTAAAAWGAALAAGTRDLIGLGDYTEEYYRTLASPWESVMGPTE